MHWAVDTDSSPLVNSLLDSGAEINARNNSDTTALIRALSFRRKNAAMLLIERGADVNAANENDETALYFAARYGYCDVSQRLLEKGALKKQRQLGRYLPLSWAAIGGHGTMIDLLCGGTEDEADPRDWTGRTPLSLAAERGHDNVVERLLKTNCVDPDSKDNNGMTPLAWAALRGQLTTVKRFLAVPEVYPNARDINGLTPLARAAWAGSTPVVEFLLETDRVEPDSKDNDGWTPFVLATLFSRHECAKRLRATNKVDVTIINTILGLKPGEPLPKKVTVNRSFDLIPPSRLRHPNRPLTTESKSPDVYTSPSSQSTSNAPMEQHHASSNAQKKRKRLVS